MAKRTDRSCADEYSKLQQKRDTIIQYFANQKIAALLADKLLGAGFITRPVYDQAKNYAPNVVERDRVAVLFDAVLASVKVNPLKYDGFLSILETEGLQDIVVLIGGDDAAASGDGRDDGGVTDSSSQRRQDNADEEGSAEARQQDEAGPSMSRKPKQFSDKALQVSVPIFNEPSPRWSHYVASFGDGKVYMMGGHDENETSMSFSRVEIFDPYLEVWEQPRPTTGEPPPHGLSGVGYTSAYDSTWNMQHLYMYGGFNGESWSSKLHCLDMVTFRWNEVKIWSLSEFERDRSKPMPKAGCGLTALYRSQLACFGGYGVKQGDQQKGSKFTPDSRYGNGRGWTNEFHLLQYESGKLYSNSLDMAGSPPPPCAYCSFTSIGVNRAVLFGGYQPDEKQITDAVYFVDIRDKLWSKLEKSEDTPQWPVGRSLHAACCINYREFRARDLEPNPQDRPQLLISGGSNSYDGTNSYGSTCSDVWMLDIASEVWKVVKPQAQSCFSPQLSSQPRCLHTMTAINIRQVRAPQFQDVVMFGGCCTKYTADASLGNEHQKSVADTTMLHFKLDWSEVPHSTQRSRDQWVLNHVETASKTQFGSSTRIRNRILDLEHCATKALIHSDQLREDEKNIDAMYHEKAREAEKKIRAAEKRAMVAEQELQAKQTSTQGTSTEVDEAKTSGFSEKQGVEVQQTPQTSHPYMYQKAHGSKRKADDNKLSTSTAKKIKKLRSSK